MIKVCTPAAIRQAEKSIIKCDNDEISLVKAAAAATVSVMEKMFADVKSVAIVAGTGNNGSDAYAIAELLLDKKIKTTVFALSGVKGKINEIFKNKILEKTEIKQIEQMGGEFDLIVDGIFGIGLNRAVESEALRAIEKINETNAKVLSIDVPSGLNAVTGEPMGACVKADVTVTFSAVKSGMLLGHGRDFTGVTVVKEVVPCCREEGFIVDHNYVKLPERKPSSHKGNYGKISIIGGSDTMPGAPLMAYESAVAASRCGGGLVRLVIGEKEKCAYKSRVTEQTLCFLPQEGEYMQFDEGIFAKICEWSDTIVLGPGMGKNPFLADMIEYLFKNARTLVLDADAINALAKNMAMLDERQCKLILTPHIGEFARLMPNVRPFDVDGLKEFAAKHCLTIALKAAVTVITDGKETLFNVRGTPAQAKGGSGDVLAGAVAAMSAIFPPVKAVAAACYYVGVSAENAAFNFSSNVSVLASDVIPLINKCTIGDFSANDIIITNL